MVSAIQHGPLLFIPACSEFTGLIGSEVSVGQGNRKQCEDGIFDDVCCLETS
ncbi:MAG: hypothetical protein ACI8P0_002953 [Planctomycetaceae bacterium]|jgi:hypothetical protein